MSAINEPSYRVESVLADRAPEKVLTEATINPAVLACKYGVRGEIFQRAQELQKEGHTITFTSVGNPHQLGEQPLTFTRQVMALCAAPFLMDSPATAGAFPPDAIARARKYLHELKGGLGAYQDSKGNGYICEEVCDFIQRRDGGFRPVANDIFLTNGASDGVKLLLQTLIRNENDGILVPIPQYPLYSAAIALYGGKLVGYHLDEQAGWALSLDRLYSALADARAAGIEVRAVVFINPGNPTSQCLGVDQLQEIVQFAYSNRLVLLADEVYQENVYGRVPFTSCYKVLSEMGAPFADNQELISFHSISKGSAGECGFRGAYFQLSNIDAGVRANLYKVVSISLSPTVPGMVALGCHVNPPRLGEASYEVAQKERAAIISSLRRRATMMSEAFNGMPGISCQPVEGSMYAFPRISLPPKAIAAARDQGKAPDTLYCLELLAHALIAATPGSSFEQEDGTFHFRTTILPTEEQFPELLQRFRKFHMDFIRRYGGLAEMDSSTMASSDNRGGLIAVPVATSKL